MKEYLLGIDNGGTVCKAAVFDRRGNLITQKSTVIPLTVNYNGMTERSIDSIINGNFSLIREITSELDGKITAVGLSGHGKGLYLLDKEGKPLGNGIGSTDSRAVSYENKYISDGIFSKAYEKTHQRLLACQPVCLLKWLKENDISVYEKIGAVLSVNDMIGYFLTGEIKSEVTSASGTSLMNLNTKEFDRDLTDLYGVGEIFHALPPLTGSFDIRGRITREAAEATGLDCGTPVSGGMFDIDACALAAGCIKDGDMCMIAGTWSINEYITSTPKWESASMNSLYCLPGFFLAEESSAASAGNLEWVRGILRERSYYELDEMVKKVDPVKSRVYFFPFLYSSNLTPEAKAAIIGLESSNSEADIIRAVYEGVVYSGYTHLEKLLSDCRKKPEYIKLAGGVLKSDVWKQMFADMTGIVLETADSVEPGCLGAAMSAGIACEVYSSISEAVSCCVRAGEKLIPNPKNTEIYRQKYRIYRELEAAISPVWKKL